MYIQKKAHVILNGKPRQFIKFEKTTVYIFYILLIDFPHLIKFVYCF